MNSQEFCYWLQGFFELSGNTRLTVKQTRIIKDHLALVFTKVTPDRSQELPGIISSRPSLKEMMEQFIKDRQLLPDGPGTYPSPTLVPGSPINPWPSPFPGIVPGIKPFGPFEITCTAADEPKIPDSRPDMPLNHIDINFKIDDEIIC